MQFLDPLRKETDDASEQQHQQPTRPRTAHAASNAAARHQSAGGNDRRRTWLPAGRKSISSNPAPQRRPETAGHASKRATFEQLKAELSAVAAGGNMQLQSLRPSSTPADASAQLQAQVLEQLATLDVNMTYSQARATHSRAHVQQPKLESTHNVLLHQSSSRGSSSSRLAADSRRQPPDQQHGPSLPGGAAPKRHPEAAAAAAVSAISEMKQWAIDQELGMMEPSTAARYASKALAAHVGMLQSEALVLQYQRRFVEAELQKLKASTWSPQQAQPQEQDHQEDQQRHLLVHHQQPTDNGCLSQPPQQQQHSQSRQPHQAHSLAGWADSHQHSTTEHSFALPSTDPSETHSSSSSSSTQTDAADDAAPEKEQQQQQQEAAGHSKSDWRGSSRSSSAGMPYLGSDSLPPSSPGLSMPHAHTLRMTHIGLGGQQLDKVQVALEAASSRVHLLDLSSNLFADAAVYDLVDLIQSRPAAADVTGLDLSHNQLLSWQSCGALGQLLSGAAAMAAASAPAAASCAGPSVGEHKAQQPAASLCGGSAAADSSAAAGDAPTAARARQPIGWHGVQPSLKRMVQPLQLQALLLQGVVIQDRGAALLAEALASTQHLQVLDLSQCGNLDGGGATICSALLQQDTLRELRLGWNALSHATAQALESVMRSPGHSLSHLYLSHCGFSDRDGALILNALVDAAKSRGSSSSNSSSSSTPSCTSSGRASNQRDWVLLDLAYNALEGGAALCVAALVAATATAAAAASSAAGSSASASGVGLSNTRGQSTAGVTSRQQLAQKQLILDGNPMGASGVRILMRAIAAEPAIGMGFCSGPLTTDSALNSTAAAAAASVSQHMQHGSSDGDTHPDQFFLQAWEGEAPAPQAQLPQGPLHVSIAKVSLLAKEKGFRASLRAAEAAQAFAAQVPTLLDAAAAVPSKPQAKGISKPPPGKAPPAPSAVAAVAAAASNALTVVHETAAGYNLYCPAGLYQLSLQHPASRHLFEQLMGLRAMLQQLQQQSKAQQLLQEQQAAATAAAATAAAAAAAAADAEVAGLQSGAQGSSGSRAQSRCVSRANSSVPAHTPSTQGPQRAASSPTPGEGSTPVAIPSRRVSRTASSMALGASGAAPRPPPKQRGQPFLVDIPALTDLKLDSKPTKLETLLQLAPWYQPLQQRQQQQQQAAAEPTPAAPSQVEQGAQDTAAKTGQAGKKKGKPKEPKILEFTVKAAAAVTGADPPVMPAALLDWAATVLQDTSCGEVWKLQLAELLMQDWLLLPQQTVHLLNMFDRGLGHDQQLVAAELAWAHLVQPVELWEEVLPATLRPSQQKQLKRVLGPRLMALDRHNLTGPYSLDLNNEVHRAVAWRLQLAALQDNATSECRYYVSWRNVNLNGVPLPDKAMGRLHLYAIPSSGRLTLDYVSYQVPVPGVTPVALPCLQALLRELRRIQQQYNMLVLRLRQQFLPGGMRKSQEEANAAAAQAREFRQPGRTRKASNLLSQKKTPAAEDLTKPATAAAVALPPKQAQGSAGQQTWWGASGFDASELLLKYRPRPVSAGAASVGSGSHRPTRDSRRETRDRRLPGGPLVPSRRQSAGSRPASTAAAMQSGPPASAAAGKMSRASSSQSDSLDSASPTQAAAAAQGRPSSSSRVARSAQRRPGSAAAAGRRSSLSDSSSVLRSQGVTDEEMLGRLLHASTPQSVAAAFVRLGCKHASAVLQLLAAREGGAAAAAALLQCLSPIVAVRFLHEMPGYESSLLPAAVRADVKPLLKPAVADSLQEVAATLRDAARARNSQLLLCVRSWASQVQALTCSQLSTVLQLLGGQSELRCGVIVALWTKVQDRHNLAKLFEALAKGEQLGLMPALGSHHVWSSLGAPDGLHFRLDLTQPEQRDVAREVVKVAVRHTLAAGKGSGVRHLLDITAEGSKPVADPEDDKLWLSLESKHSLLEFDFARTWQQELHVMEGAAKRIQRAWCSRAAANLAGFLPGQRSSGTSSSAKAAGSKQLGSDLGAKPGVGSLPGSLSCVLLSPSGVSTVPAGSFTAGLPATGTGERAHGSSSNSSSTMQLLSQSQVTGSPLGLTPSTSYTGETSYSSYTVYSSGTSRLFSGGSMSWQPSELSGWSGVEQQASGLAGEEGVQQQQQQQQQRVQQGVDLAGALASVKAAGMLAPSSSDPTPRLASG